MSSGRDRFVYLHFAILVGVLIFAFVLNLCLGEVTLNPLQAINSLFAPSQNMPSGLAEVIWQIRLPRLLLAMVVGAGLSMSGYLLQALSRNYLADPYLTGVSSGAGLSVACAILLGVDFTFVPLAAFIGGLIVSMIVAVMARGPQGLSVTRLLLAGVAISAICGSLITLILVASGNPTQAQGIFFWLAGGIAGRGWNELICAASYIFIGLTAAFFLSKPLRVMSLGAQPAQTLGLNVHVMQWSVLALAVLACGAAVSVSGLVGFVGLIAPYIARQLYSRDERLQLVACVLIGSSLVLLSDLVARMFGQGQELPLGTLLAIVGAPFFLWLVVKQKSEGL
jgi:iron complex transport system permease protein